MRRAALSLALIVLLSLPAVAVWAQRPPEAILPPKEAPVPKPKRQASQAAISEKTLDAPSLDAIGLTDTPGAFGRDLWKGSNYAEIMKLLAAQQNAAPSIAAHNLLVRLATAPAPVPPSEGMEPGAWLKLRLHMLLMLGEEKSLRDMLAMVPGAGNRAYLDRLLVEQELLKLNTTKACEKVAQSIALYKDPFWLEANAFCLAEAKKPEEADLALQVLREEAGDAKSDFPFEEAVRKMMGDTGKMKPLERFDYEPLELAVALEAGLTFDAKLDATTATVTPAAARMLALYSKLPLNLRIELAERAFRAGALPREQLAELYKSVSFKSDVFEKALKEKKFPDHKVEARALALQVAEKDATIINDASKQFPADLAQRLFYPEQNMDGWKKLSPAKDIRIAAAQKAFDIPVERAVWESFANQPEAEGGANIVGLNLLKEAAAAHRTGEVALRGLMLQDMGMNSVTLSAVIEAFRVAGLEKDASALAQEALWPLGQ